MNDAKTKRKKLKKSYGAKRKVFVKPPTQRVTRVSNALGAHPWQLQLIHRHREVRTRGATEIDVWHF